MKTNQDGHVFAKNVRARFVVALALVMICCMAVGAAAASVYTVSVTADGKTQMVKTAERKSEKVIQQAGVTVGTDDAIDLSKFKAGSDVNDGNEIRVLRAQNVKIYDGKDLAAKLTVAGTVEDALNAAKLVLGEKDSINIPMDTELTEATTIKIVRSDSVKLIVGGKEFYVPFAGGTVADVLDRQGILLGTNDEVEPSKNTTLKRGDSVTVKRVVYKTRLVNEKIKFKTKTKYDASVKAGTTKVLKEGQNGAREVVYKDKVVDGKVVESNELKSKVLKEPQDKVVATGTKVTVSAKGCISSMALPSKYELSGGVPTNPKSVIRGQSTAYTAGAGAKCSTGVTPRPGYVAVDPREIPYGTEMYIVSSDGKQVYGYAIAADTGGFIYNSNTVVDLYMNSESQCRQWGRRNVTIYILNWG